MQDLLAEFEIQQPVESAREPALLEAGSRIAVEIVVPDDTGERDSGGRLGHTYRRMLQCAAAAVGGVASGTRVLTAGTVRR